MQMCMSDASVASNQRGLQQVGLYMDIACHICYNISHRNPAALSGETD